MDNKEVNNSKLNSAYSKIRDAARAIVLKVDPAPPPTPGGELIQSIRALLEELRDDLDKVEAEQVRQAWYDPSFNFITESMMRAYIDPSNDLRLLGFEPPFSNLEELIGPTLGRRLSGSDSKASTSELRDLFKATELMYEAELELLTQSEDSIRIPFDEGVLDLLQWLGVTDIFIRSANNTMVVTKTYDNE